MKIILYSLLFLSIFISSCETESDKKTKQNMTNTAAVSTEDVQHLDIKVVQFEELISYLEVSRSDYTVVNFWATWCVPCIKELPYFFEVMQDEKYKYVEWVFVTLDDLKLLDTKVKDFIISNNYVQATHILLDDNGRQQMWIDSINTNWEGSIPATALYEKGKQKDFHEGIFTKNELISFLDKNIN